MRLFERDGRAPRIHPSATIAGTAVLVGDVTLAEGCHVGHGVVIESSGAPVVIGRESVVLANTVVRSVGGASRPAFAVTIGERTLVAPACVLTGCRIGSRCYVATAVLVFHGAEIGDDVRVGAGAIVHHHARLAAGARVGMREIAVPGPDGAAVCTGDVAAARGLLAGADFFGRVFEESAADQGELHERVMARLLQELRGHVDRPIAGG